MDRAVVTWKRCAQCRIRYSPAAAREFVGDRCHWCASGAPQAWCLGVSNETQDGLFVPFWDFDGVPYARVERGLFDVQRAFGLGNVHVLRSSPGDNYMAFAFDKMPEVECKAALRAHPDQDSGHVECWDYRGHTTLRWTSKRDGVVIEWIGCLQRRGHVSHWSQSWAHWRFFAELYEGVMLRLPTRPDSLSRVRIEGYRSRHVGMQHVVAGTRTASSRSAEVRDALPRSPASLARPCATGSRSMTGASRCSDSPDGSIKWTRRRESAKRGGGSDDF